MQTSAINAVDQMLMAGIQRQLESDASHQTKVDWLCSLEPAIYKMWNHGMTSVKPVMFMTEDDLIH